MAIDSQSPRARRRALEPERPLDYSEPDFTSWSAKLDAFVPVESRNAVPSTSPQAAAVAEPAPAAPGLSASLQELINFDGAMAAALVDSGTGMILGQAGAGIDLDLAAAGASVMLRARRASVRTLGLPDQIEDMLVTLTTQLQIIRPLSESPSIFIYLIVDKAKSSLAMARYKATAADGIIVL